MKRELRLVVLGVVISALSISGCAKKDGVSVPRGKGKIVITYVRPSYQPEMEVITQRNIRDFEAMHPEIKINYINISGDFVAKYLTMIAGGTAPDVMYTADSMFPDFASRGIFLNLDPYIAGDTETNINDYYQEVLEAQKYNGKQYSFPTVFSPIVLFYNKTLFDQARIKYPDETWTWNTLLDRAKKLTKDINGDGRIDQFGLYVPPSCNRWPLFVWENGGNILNKEQTKCLLDQPEAIEAFQFLVDLINKYHVSPTLSQTKEQSYVSIFQTGKLAMVFDSRFSLKEYKALKRFDWDVAVVPKGKYRYTTVTIGGNAIYAKAKHPEEAWEFVKFMASSKVMTDHVKSGNALGSLKSVSGALVKSHPGEPPDNDYAFIKSIKYIKPTFTYPKAEIYFIMDTYLERVWLGLETAEETCKEIAKKVNVILAEEK